MRMVPRKWYPQDQLDPQSITFGAQFGNQPGNTGPSKIGADAWFDRHDAGRFEVMEQCFKTAPDETLTLVTITNERMLEDEETTGLRW